MKKRTITWTWENQETQELFIEWIKFPDESQSSHEVDQMERLLDLRPPTRVLDLGCGKGRHALELAQRGYQVTAIDVAAVYLQRAQRQALEQHLAIEFRLPVPAFRTSKIIGNHRWGQPCRLIRERRRSRRPAGHDRVA